MTGREEKQRLEHEWIREQAGRECQRWDPLSWDTELGHRAWAQPLQGAAGIYRGKAANDRGFLAGLGTEMT